MHSNITQLTRKGHFTRVSLIVFPLFLSLNIELMASIPKIHVIFSIQEAKRYVLKVGRNNIDSLQFQLANELTKDLRGAFGFLRWSEGADSLAKDAFVFQFSLIEDKDNPAIKPVKIKVRIRGQIFANDQLELFPDWEFRKIGEIYPINSAKVKKKLMEFCQEQLKNPTVKSQIIEQLLTNIPLAQAFSLLDDRRGVVPIHEDSIRSSYHNNDTKFRIFCKIKSEEKTWHCNFVLVARGRCKTCVAPFTNGIMGEIDLGQNQAIDLCRDCSQPAKSESKVYIKSYKPLPEGFDREMNRKP